MSPEQHAKVLEARERNRVTPEGRALGESMVRITEPAIARLADEGEPDERCKSCAFRLGTVPNGCPQTQLDALKAVIEDVPFMCHQADRAGWPCHGWFAARVHLNRLARVKGPLPDMQCPWDFSPPDEPAAPPTEHEVKP